MLGMCLTSSGLADERFDEVITRTTDTSPVAVAMALRLGRVLGCEPATFGSDEEPALGLSEPVRAAVDEAVKLGAFDYMKKPVDLEELKLLADRARGASVDRAAVGLSGGVAIAEIWRLGYAEKRADACLPWE